MREGGGGVNGGRGGLLVGVCSARRRCSGGRADTTIALPRGGDFVLVTADQKLLPGGTCHPASRPVGIEAAVQPTTAAALRSGRWSICSWRIAEAYARSKRLGTAIVMSNPQRAFIAPFSRLKTRIGETPTNGLIAR